MFNLRYDRKKQRVWLANQRVHHGALGAWLVSAGFALMYHDKSDWRFWFKLGPQDSPSLSIVVPLEGIGSAEDNGR